MRGRTKYQFHQSIVQVSLPLMHAPADKLPAQSRWFRFSAFIIWLRDLAFGHHPLVLWLLNAGVLLLLAGWIVWDARFSATWDHLEFQIGWTQDGSDLDEFANSLTAQWKIFALGIMVAVGMVSLAMLTFGMTMGSRGHRTLSSWMIVLSLACCWLGLINGWDELMWTGKRLRIDSHLAAFQPIAQSLQQDWPRMDGERENIGPFMAYPAGKPKTLLLLTTPPMAQSGPTFSSIERSDAGGIRFQLSGNERGVWLEWHPLGKQPESFVGGLLEPHHLTRMVSLGDGWFLARYDQAAIAS
ncbi:hypothetical protein Pan97_36400 [Bremerella volcania]|uniref:Uncharacterized protein n=1 Tax=Bremerella volcania TaxID=2527984 RepID=A0A518CBJ5_9BACT|nr:hypothetical protein [Bremerella volcania]QDU76588.1 hypothetical protein Pan97_36400 [Bremerella volcania]